MKKIILWAAVAIAFSTILVSCKKDTARFPAVIAVQQGSVEQLIKGQDPMPGTDGNSYELGVVFTSAVNGHIKSFKLHLPEPGNYRVTLWKSGDRSIVASNQISCVHTDSWTDSLEVNNFIQANTEYILTVNTSVFYVLESGAGMFPFKNGDITLTGFAGKPGAAQAFPDLPLSQTPAGFVDFTFQPSE